VLEADGGQGSRFQKAKPFPWIAITTFREQKLGKKEKAARGKEEFILQDELKVRACDKGSSSNHKVSRNWKFIYSILKSFPNRKPKIKEYRGAGGFSMVYLNVL